MGSTPLVNIGMPVYNEELHLEDALRSLLSQSFKDFELIISDNASTDRTGAICLTYAAKDPRVRYSRMKTNVGAIANANHLVQLGNAPYFFFASGHDIRHESFIARCIEILEHDTSVVLCYPATRWLEPDGHLGDVMSGQPDTRGQSQASRFRTVLWGLGSYAYPIYGILRTDALKKTSPMRIAVGPDVVLLHELALLGAFAAVPEPLLYMRRLSDFGSWDHYLVKAIGPGGEKSSAWYLYSEIIYEHLRIVAKHTKNPMLALSLIFCLLTKYRWILQGLRRRPKRHAD